MAVCCLLGWCVGSSALVCWRGKVNEAACCYGKEHCIVEICTKKFTNPPNSGRERGRERQSETHTDRHTHTHRHTDTHTHIHTYRHTHTHAHIQTHTHTCAQASPALRPPSPLWQRGVGKMSGPRRGYVPASDAMQVALVVSSQYERHSDVVSHTGPGFC